MEITFLLFNNWKGQFFNRRTKFGMYIRSVSSGVDAIPSIFLEKYRIQSMQAEWWLHHFQWIAADSKARPECYSPVRAPPADGSLNSSNRCRGLILQRLYRSPDFDGNPSYVLLNHGQIGNNSWQSPPHRSGSLWKALPLFQVPTGAPSQFARYMQDISPFVRSFCLPWRRCPIKASHRQPPQPCYHSNGNRDRGDHGPVTSCRT